MADLRRRYRLEVGRLKRRFPDEAATVQRAAECLSGI